MTEPEGLASLCILGGFGIRLSPANSSLGLLDDKQQVISTASTSLHGPGYVHSFTYVFIHIPTWPWAQDRQTDSHSSVAFPLPRHTSIAEGTGALGWTALAG